MGGGSSGGGSSHITQTVTNPKVPKGFEGLAEALKLISSGMLGAPVNLGPIPGLDAPKSGPLIPQGSMGNLMSNPAFQMGAGGLGVMGGKRRTQPLRQAAAIQRVSQLPPISRGIPKPSFGDFFTLNAPKPAQPSNPNMAY